MTFGSDDDERTFRQALRKRHFKIILVEGHRKEHVAPCDEFGVPLSRTLCRKNYDLEKRKRSKTMLHRTGKECPRCLQKYDACMTPVLDRRSNPEELQFHWLWHGEPACGQNCYGMATGFLGLVECKKCKAIARKYR